MKSNKEKIYRSPEDWAHTLDATSYYITREKGTEPAFTGKYCDCNKQGKYLCICCGEVLFNSEDKFNAGCGWPSFREPASNEVIEEYEDCSHHMIRTEVTCSRCDAHLGHVFPDGPLPTKLRYCINSAAIYLNEDIS